MKPARKPARAPHSLSRKGSTGRWPARTRRQSLALWAAACRQVVWLHLAEMQAAASSMSASGSAGVTQAWASPLSLWESWRLLSTSRAWRWHRRRQRRRREGGDWQLTCYPSTWWRLLACVGHDSWRCGSGFDTSGRKSPRGCCCRNAVQPHAWPPRPDARQNPAVTRCRLRECSQTHCGSGTGVRAPSSKPHQAYLSGLPSSAPMSRGRC